MCEEGTDCTDCGPRGGDPTLPSPPPPPAPTVDVSGMYQTNYILATETEPHFYLYAQSAADELQVTDLTDPDAPWSPATGHVINTTTLVLDVSIFGSFVGTSATHPHAQRPDPSALGAQSAPH